MLKRASNADRRRGLLERLWRGTAVAALGAGVATIAASAPASAQAPARDRIPALASVDFAGDGLRRKQQRPLRPQPVPDPAGRAARFLNAATQVCNDLACPHSSRRSSHEHETR